MMKNKKIASKTKFGLERAMTILTGRLWFLQRGIIGTFKRLAELDNTIKIDFVFIFVVS